MNSGSFDSAPIAFAVIPEIDSAPIIRGLWILFALYWLVSALKLKETKKRESPLQRLVYVLPLIAAFGLISRPEAHYSWLGMRFVPDIAAVHWIAVLLTAAGVAIAIWARWHLGANWSGVVTLKEGHELIRTGPYRSIRHPIYTGILLMRRILPGSGIRPPLHRTPTAHRHVPPAPVLTSSRAQTPLM